MDFSEKQAELLAKLKETGYSAFGGDKRVALDYTADQMEKVLLYDTALIKEQTQARLRGEESERESDMETAVYERQASGLDALNKMCADLGLEPFADIDTRDREAVAAWTGQCRRELYNRGIGKGHT